MLDDVVKSVKDALSVTKHSTMRYQGMSSLNY